MPSRELKTRIEHELDTRSVALGVWLYRRTGGRITRLWRRRGIVLTTTGRRSGRPRTVLVQVFQHGNDLFVVAANSGLPRRPGWYFNLMAEPRVVAELDDQRLLLRAERLTARQAAERWPHVLAVAPDYARYAHRTGRIPPIFLLVPEPVGQEPTQRVEAVSAASITAGLRRRPALAATSAAVAVSAYGCAVGLATGSDPYLRHLTGRLPFRSPLVGGLALAVVVGLPHTVAARDAWRGDARSDQSAMVAGSLLCAWLLAEYAILRECSFLDPLYGAAGVGLVLAGRHGRKEAPSWPHDQPPIASRS
ncbi:MAG TPA: nitroreductase/quinone reductase family protein [Jiangellaceae bacterium]